ncbi:MAG: T9SS type A sorting domain-containing protein [Crocinitomicaceae bacterium]
MQKLFTSILFIFLSISVFSQTTFQRAFGGTASDEGLSVRQTPDGGYIIAGTTTSYGSGGRDVLVIKTDFAGDTIWTRTYGDSNGNEYGYCIQLTNDGGYIVSGSSQNFFSGEEDMYLLKLKANGDTSWTRNYGGNGFEGGYYVQQTSDGGYIMSGQTPAFGAGGFDVYLVKINDNGNIAWTKTYGGLDAEYANAVQQTSDGGYIITGSNGNTFGFGGSDFYLIKTDSLGNHIWSKTYGDTGFEEGKAVKQTTDGGYIIAGSSENTLGPLGPNFCLIKTNSVGDTLWAKLYGGSMIDECYDVQQTSDGGYIMVGKSFSFSTNGDYDVYVVKVNSQGIEQWSKTYGGSTTNHNEIGYSIQQTSDNGFIITGETLYGFGVGLRNLYLIKTDSLGNSGCNEGTPVTVVSNYSPQVATTPTSVGTGGNMLMAVTQIHAGTTQTNLCLNIPNAIQDINENFSINVYPNPFDSKVTISISDNVQINSINIHNIFGQVVKSQVDFSKSHSSNSIILELNELKNGIYFIELVASGFNKTLKLIKQ